jgi:hypothetical protein
MNTLNLLLQTYQHADKSGQNWYIEANNFARELSKKYDVSLIKVAAIISALSPSVSWKVNKIDAELLIKAGKRNPTGSRKFSTYGQNVVKAIDILRAKDSEVEAMFRSNTKTQSFFYNIWQPDNAEYVTIDRHMLRIIGHTGNFPHPAKYRELSKLFKDAAKHAGIVPSTFQAILWQDKINRDQVEQFKDVPF